MLLEDFIKDLQNSYIERNIMPQILEILEEHFSQNNQNIQPSVQETVWSNNEETPLFKAGIEYNVEKNPYDEIMSNPDMSMEEKTQKMKELTEQIQKRIERDYNLRMAKILGGAGLQLASTFIPGTAPIKGVAGLTKAIAPILGKRIAPSVSKGILNGGLAGFIEGVGRGMVQDENSLKTGIQDSATGAISGGALSGGEAKLKLMQQVKDSNAIYKMRPEWGIAYRKSSGDPQKAIDTLLEKQNGFVPNAAYKSGIGDIDFVWGEHKPAKNKNSQSQGTGIKHIVESRFEHGVNGTKFVQQIPDIIDKGTVVLDKAHPLNKNVATQDGMTAFQPNFWNRGLKGFQNRNIIKTGYPLDEETIPQVESILNEGIALNKNSQYVPYKPNFKQKINDLKNDFYYNLLKFWKLR